MRRRKTHKSLAVSHLFAYFANGNPMCTMRTRQEYVDIIKAHAEELQSRFGITSMRLFGSIARNEHREESDVDLFVTMPPKMMNYIAAAQYLEELLGKNVDLIQDHRHLRPFFRKQIERDGIIVIPATKGR